MPWGWMARVLSRGPGGGRQRTFTTTPRQNPVPLSNQSLFLSSYTFTRLRSLAGAATRAIIEAWAYRHSGRGDDTLRSEYSSGRGRRGVMRMVSRSVRAAFGDGQALCVRRAGDDDRRLAAAVRTMRCRPRRVALRGEEDVAGTETIAMDRRWVVSVASLVQAESEEPRWQKR
jgi:hypothetical protein